MRKVLHNGDGNPSRVNNITTALGRILNLTSSLGVQDPFTRTIKYLASSDDEAPIEDQPLPADASPIALSLDYVPDSDLEEDPKEDPKEDHADYLGDGGDGDDESSDDDYDDDDTNDEDEEPFEDEDDDEEEEEHLAPADSSAIDMYGYCKNHKKTVKTGQTRTRERIECTRVGTWQSKTSPKPLIGQAYKENDTRGLLTNTQEVENYTEFSVIKAQELQRYGIASMAIRVLNLIQGPRFEIQSLQGIKSQDES
ncbi:hypothetical protein Tco_0067227 [Tanacetum coccineum]